MCWFFFLVQKVNSLYFSAKYVGYSIILKFTSNLFIIKLYVWMIISYLYKLRKFVWVFCAILLKLDQDRNQDQDESEDEEEDDDDSI